MGAKAAIAAIVDSAAIAAIVDSAAIAAKVDPAGYHDRSGLNIHKVVPRTKWLMKPSQRA